MRIIKKILKWFFYILLIPITYFLISLLLTYFTVNKSDDLRDNSKVIYLSTNGVHLDIVIPKDNVSENLLKGLNQEGNYYSFGWGDENFYINTPTWDDLTFGNAFSALFLKSTTLMHVTRYNSVKKSWVKVDLSEAELLKINEHILNTFSITKSNEKVIIAAAGYQQNDNFYKVKGSYSCFKTCNSWVNKGFKSSGLKACFWTPFDFGLIGKYE